MTSIEDSTVASSNLLSSAPKLAHLKPTTTPVRASKVFFITLQDGTVWHCAAKVRFEYLAGGAILVRFPRVFGRKEGQTLGFFN
jgi:hypothetical protein